MIHRRRKPHFFGEFHDLHAIRRQLRETSLRTRRNPAHVRMRNERAGNERPGDIRRKLGVGFDARHVDGDVLIRSYEQPHLGARRRRVQFRGFRFDVEQPRIFGPLSEFLNYGFRIGLILRR